MLVSSLKGEKFHEIESVNASLTDLADRREKLKNLLNAQQQSVESMLKSTGTKIELTLVDQNTLISSEIKALLSSDKLVKKKLYALVEQVLADQKAGHLLNA